MAAVTESEEVSSSFPLPPMQYIDLYTNEAVANNTAPQPPACMTTEPYTMFGAPFFPNESIVRSLESQKVRRLYPQSYEHKKELKRMNHSLLANFLDLLEVLVKSPDSEQRTEKIEDIKLLFINMHHLINEYRQHQARETIRVMMAVQKKQRIDIAERFQKQLEKVTESLQIYRNSMPDVKPTVLAELVNAYQISMDVDEADEEANLKQLSAQLISMDQIMSDIVDELDC